MTAAALHPVETPQPEPSAPGSGGDGGSSNRFENRLREVEGSVREFRTEIKHLATKAWVLGGVVGGMGFAASLAVGLTLIFLKNCSPAP